MRCFTCERDKPATEFRISKVMKTGYRKQCKQCERIGISGPKHFIYPEQFMLNDIFMISVLNERYGQCPKRTNELHDSETKADEYRLARKTGITNGKRASDSGGIHPMVQA